MGVSINYNSISGTNTHDATAVASDILAGKTAYIGGEKVTGTMPTKAAATITPGTSNQTIAAGQYLSGVQTIAGDADLISANIKAGANIFGVAGNANVVDTSAGTATAAQILSGQVAFVDGTKVTGTMASKAAATYTPGTANQTISAGQYLAGTQTIAGDADLIPGNIKAGVNIFGVTGTFTSGGYEDRVISIPTNFRDLADYPQYPNNGNNNHRTLTVTGSSKIKGVEYVLKGTNDGRIMQYVFYPPAETMAGASISEVCMLKSNYVLTNLQSFLNSSSYHTELSYTSVIFKDDSTVQLRIVCDLLVPLTVDLRIFY